MPRPLSAMRTSDPAVAAVPQPHLDVGLLARVLDRVVDQVAEDNVQVHVPRPHGAGLQVELDRVGRHAIAEADGPGAVLQQRPEQDVLHVGVGAADIEAARVQQLVDQPVQPVEVFQHELVEVGLFLLAHLAAVERLQVELHRGDGGFQFVGDAVDEVRLPPAEIDRLDGEDQVDDHAGQQQADERGAQREQDPIQGRQPPAPQRPNTHSSTQPTVSTTSRAIMTMASRMGKRKERRVNMVVEGWTMAGETHVEVLTRGLSPGVGTLGA